MRHKTLTAAVRSTLALACLLSAALGCKSVDYRGKGFDDEVAKSVGQMRKADPDNKTKWGMTTKAQEIEDNLGVR